MCSNVSVITMSYNGKTAQTKPNKFRQLVEDTEHSFSL